MFKEYGVKDYENPKWQKVRLHILDRDAYCCSACFDSESKLNVHHMYYVSGRALWDYPMHALETLCDECHKKVHNCSFQVTVTRQSFVTYKYMCLDEKEQKNYFDIYLQMMLKINSKTDTKVMRLVEDAFCKSTPYKKYIKMYKKMKKAGEL